jgi:hypothetical protein
VRFVDDLFHLSPNGVSATGRAKAAQKRAKIRDLGQAGTETIKAGSDSAELGFERAGIEAKRGYDGRSVYLIMTGGNLLGQPQRQKFFSHPIV